MPLANEDSLRLNVLLANAVAIRINEGTLQVHGLLKDNKESCFNLNPNCRAEQYIRLVRELLSSVVLGALGGYPVFLKRWTRMGQASDARLENLVLLGEPEAAVAASGAEGLTDEIARRVWWAMPDADNARRMLARPAVVQGEMGKILASFLVEFLSFEEEPRAIIESVALVLQPGLIDEETKLDIWKRGKQKSVFRIGFLKTLPDELPEFVAEHEPDTSTALETLAGLGNSFAAMLKRLLSCQGQTYLETCAWIIAKPANQDAVVALLDTVSDYFKSVKVFMTKYADFKRLDYEIEQLLNAPEQHVHPASGELSQFICHCPEYLQPLRAMLILAHCDSALVTPIFAVTDAVGSVMRTKIEPVFKPMTKNIQTLRQLMTLAN